MLPVDIRTQLELMDEYEKFAAFLLGLSLSDEQLDELQKHLKAVAPESKNRIARMWATLRKFKKDGLEEQRTKLPTLEIEVEGLIPDLSARAIDASPVQAPKSQSRYKAT